MKIVFLHGWQRGGAVAMNIDSGRARLVLLCPAWEKWGTVKTAKPGTVILHSRADDVIPFADSEELVVQSRRMRFWARSDAVNHVNFLKRSLLLLWAVWLSVVFLSNLTDALKGIGLLGESWAFASGNLKFIQETTARYGTPDWVNGMLFAGVILWEGVAALLFWWAARTFRGKESGRKIMYFAFTTSLLLWGAFLIADEVFISYSVESTHLRLFIAHLVTLMTIELLPEA
jgi:hypothetical protein